MRPGLRHAAAIHDGCHASCSCRATDGAGAPYKCSFRRDRIPRAAQRYRDHTVPTSHPCPSSFRSDWRDRSESPRRAADPGMTCSAEATRRSVRDLHPEYQRRKWRQSALICFCRSSPHGSDSRESRGRRARRSSASRDRVGIFHLHPRGATAHHVFEMAPAHLRLPLLVRIVQFLCGLREVDSLLLPGVRDIVRQPRLD
jgi:hypothetical protein